MIFHEINSVNITKSVPNFDISQAILNISKSSCIINSNNNSTGFLVYLPINMENNKLKILYGLLTTNSALSSKQLQPGEELKLYFYSSKQYFNYIIQKNTFVFTCPFLDASFVEIPRGTIPNVEYLQTWGNSSEGQKIYFINSSNIDNISLINGKIVDFYGTDILYTIQKKDNCYPFPGSAMITINEQSSCFVLGINKQFSFESNKMNRVTKINNVIEAISCLFNHNILMPQKTLSPAKNLSNSEIAELEKEGLERTANPDLFISPSSFMVTPIWFYRTQYAWFWTPKKPKSYNIEDIKKCNWSLISQKRTITAIGGDYNGLEPAGRNIRLIKFLIDSDLIFLTSK